MLEFFVINRFGILYTVLWLNKDKTFLAATEMHVNKHKHGYQNATFSTTKIAFHWVRNVSNRITVVPNVIP